MERLKQFVIFYRKAKTDLAIAKVGKASQIEFPSYIEELYDLSEYAVESRYGQIHDDIENIDIYFERVESLGCFVEDIHNQSQGG